jgi:hypothetical protein
MSFIEWLLGMIFGKDFVFKKNNSEDKDEDSEDEHDDGLDR